MFLPSWTFNEIGTNWRHFSTRVDQERADQGLSPGKQEHRQFSFIRGADLPIVKVFSAGTSLADYGAEVFVPPPPHPWVGAEGQALPFSLRRKDHRERQEGFPSKL